MKKFTPKLNLALKINQMMQEHTPKITQSLKQHDTQSDTQNLKQHDPQSEPN
jgi:hypothetical protein